MASKASLRRVTEWCDCREGPCVAAPAGWRCLCCAREGEQGAQDDQRGTYVVDGGGHGAGRRGRGGWRGTAWRAGGERGKMMEVGRLSTELSLPARCVRQPVGPHSRPPSDHPTTPATWRSSCPLAPISRSIHQSQSALPSANGQPVGISISGRCVRPRALASGTASPASCPAPLRCLPLILPTSPGSPTQPSPPCRAQPPRYVVASTRRASNTLMFYILGSISRLVASSVAPLHRAL